MKSITLGLRANWEQFTLLIVVNAFVGAMVGMERTLLPIMAQDEFGLVSKSIVLSFLVTFGVVKALANLFAGRLSDRWGRKHILIAGWLVGLPVPFMIILAPTWEWIVIANVLLGINQGLCWSTTVIMKIDLVGPKQRGLAMGLNEFAGYLAVSFAAAATGFLAASYGLRPVPFYPGIGIAVAGLLFSIFLIRETLPYTQAEARLATNNTAASQAQLSFRQVFWLTSWKDKNLFSASQAGLVNNLNDGMMWGLFPVFLAGCGVPVAQIGILAATYPGIWGVSQLVTGWLSDHIGRKWLIAAGMWCQAVGIGVIVLGNSFGAWYLGAVLLGVGTAMVYPTLLAAISDVAHPEWRASAVGTYRLWRDLGYAIGALLAGLLADLFGITVAIAAVGVLTFLSGVVVAWVMRETLPARAPLALGHSD